MEKTNRIDSEFELMRFIQKLMMADIDIPSNVSLEIDSNTLKSEITNNFFKVHRIDTSNVDNVDVTRFTYIGQKVTFKS